MQKLLAIINVIAWSGFWAFGYLALTADGFSEKQVFVAALLAAGGFFAGMLAYLRLVRHAEARGFSKTNQLDPQLRDAAQARHPL